MDLFIYPEEVPGSVDMPLCENEEIWCVLTRDSGLHTGKKAQVSCHTQVTHQTHEESSPAMYVGCIMVDNV